MCQMRVLSEILENFNFEIGWLKKLRGKLKSFSIGATFLRIFQKFLNFRISSALEIFILCFYNILFLDMQSSCCLLTLYTRDELATG